MIGERESLDSGNYYPSFARYYSRRSAPAFTGIVNDVTMRRKIFAGDDGLLANAIAEVTAKASHESFRYGGWDGIDDGSVGDFIAKHRTS